MPTVPFECLVYGTDVVEPWDISRFVWDMLQAPHVMSFGGLEERQECFTHLLDRRLQVWVWRLSTTPQVMGDVLKEFSLTMRIPCPSASFLRPTVVSGPCRCPPWGNGGLEITKSPFARRVELDYPVRMDCVLRNHGGVGSHLRKLMRPELADHADSGTAPSRLVRKIALASEEQVARLLRWRRVRYGFLGFQSFCFQLRNLFVAVPFLLDAIHPVLLRLAKSHSVALDLVTPEQVKFV